MSNKTKVSSRHTLWEIRKLLEVVSSCNSQPNCMGILNQAISDAETFVRFDTSDAELRSPIEQVLEELTYFQTKEDTILLNATNTKMSDAEFRQFVINTLESK